MITSDELENISHLNWHLLNEVNKCNSKILLRILKNPKLLIKKLDKIQNDPKSLYLCESDYFFDKIVLYRGLRREYSIQLVFLKNSKTDYIHNHRFPFSTLVLDGSYEHSVYTLDGSTLGEVAFSLSKSMITLPVTKVPVPSVARIEKRGSIYSISENLFHSAKVIQPHISLMIKGPASLDRLLMIDPEKKNAKWEYGSQFESSKDQLGKKMSSDKFMELSSRVKRSLSGVSRDDK